MSILNLPIIDSTNESDFRDYFTVELVKTELKFEGFDLVIFPEDFEHICYEYGDDAQYKGKFSFRRARKMPLVKEFCGGNLPYVLIHQTERDNKSVCVLSESAEFCMFLVPIQSEKGNYFRIGTIIAYGKKVEEKIEKQKNNGITIPEIKKVFE